MIMDYGRPVSWVEVGRILVVGRNWRGRPITAAPKKTVSIMTLFPRNALRAFRGRDTRKHHGPVPFPGGGAKPKAACQPGPAEAQSKASSTPAKEPPWTPFTWP